MSNLLLYWHFAWKKGAPPRFPVTLGLAVTSIDEMKPLSLIMGAVVVVVGGGIVYALSTSHAAKTNGPVNPAANVASAAPSPAPAAVTTPVADNQPAPGGSAPNANTQPLAATADAPGNPPAQAGAHQGNGKRMQQIFAQLGLSADQQKQIDQIRASITDHKQRREAIMQVLTPDQQAKFQQLRAQMQAQHGKGKGAGAQT